MSRTEMAKIAKTSNKKTGKRPRADKFKGKKQSQYALDASNGGAKRKKGGQRWKQKAGGEEAAETNPADLMLQTVASAVAEKKSKEELMSKAINEKIRKRDESADGVTAAGIPEKNLVEISDARLKSRILYCNPVCFMTTVVPRVVREKASDPSKGEQATEVDAEGDSDGEQGEAQPKAENTQGDREGMVQLGAGGSGRNVMVSPSCVALYTLCPNAHCSLVPYSLGQLDFQQHIQLHP